jgi:hypothetical protein
LTFWGSNAEKICNSEEYIKGKTRKHENHVADNPDMTEFPSEAGQSGKPE